MNVHIVSIYYVHFLKFKLNIIFDDFKKGCEWCSFSWVYFPMILKYKIKVCVRSFLLRKIHSSLFNNSITVSGRRRSPFTFCKNNYRYTILCITYVLHPFSLISIFFNTLAANRIVWFEFFRSISSPLIQSMTLRNRLIFLSIYTCPFLRRTIKIYRVECKQYFIITDYGTRVGGVTPQFTVFEILNFYNGISMFWF